MEGYKEFMEELRGQVAEKMGEGYETAVHQVAKANLGVMDALVVSQKNGKGTASPNFYLQPLFREYQSGRGMEDIAGDIADTYHAQAAGMDRFAGILGDIMEYEKIKGRVYFRLLCTERNRAFLKDVLHFEILDLSMAVYILAGEDGDRTASVPVQRRLLEAWGVPAEKVRGQAAGNTPLLFPWKALPLASMVAGALCQTGADRSAGEIQEAAESMLRGTGKGWPSILTNSKGINGFSTVLYPGALKECADSAGKDLFVLPSSIHEALLFPADAPIGAGELQGMVREVNRTVVEEADILTDSVYFYDRQKNELSIAGEERECVKL